MGFPVKALISTICFITAITAHASNDLVVGVWLFNEGKGWYTYNEAVMRSSVLGDRSWVDGRFGKCLDFSTNQLSRIRDLPQQMPAEEITVTAWAKILDFRNARLFDSTPDFDNPNWTIGVLLPWDNSVRWRFGSPYIELTAEFDTDVKDIWRHWAFVHSRRDNLMAIYLDGELLASLNTSTRFIPPEDASSLVIGGPDRFHGLIDEFAIFNIPLAERDIRSVMARGLATVLTVAPNYKLATSWGNIKSGLISLNNIIRDTRW